MAEPGRVADWRMALLYDVAVEAGLFSRSCCTHADAAAVVRHLARAIRHWAKGLDDRVRRVEPSASTR